MAKEISGWEDLDKKLAELSDPKKQIKVIRSAITFALTPTQKLARLNAPKGSKAHKTYKGRLVAPGFTGRNIKKRTIVGTTNDDFVVKGLVGVSSEAWYSLLYETGFTQKTKAGNTIQVIPATHWLTKSYEATQEEAVNRFVKKIKQNIEKVAAK